MIVGIDGLRYQSRMRIDIYTHILPETWPDPRERYGYGGFVRLEHHKPCCARMLIDDKAFREITDQCWSPGRRIADCDDTGVTLQVLSTVPVMFSYWAKPADAHDLSRILNDHIAGVVAEHLSRFVRLGTHVNDWNLDNPALFPIFECAQELGAAVFVHPWDMMGKDRMPKYWLPWLVGMPDETSLAICSVIFGGVLKRLPRLRIGFAHGGGSFSRTIGRVEYGFTVRPDLCAVDNNVNPRYYLGRFYVDSLVHDADTLRHLIKTVGAERIALGSDYPFPLGEARPGALMESMGDLSQETRDRLVFGTATEFPALDKHPGILQRKTPSV